MRVVVLGASGFLGRAICEDLVSSGIQTIAVMRSKADDIMANSVQVLNCYHEISQDLNGAICIHLATPGHFYGRNADERLRQIQESVLLTKWLTEFGFAKIVFASSAAVYGDQLSRPAVETDPTIESDDYAKLKISCERVLRDDVDIIFRIANVYGVGMSDRNVLSDMLKQIEPNNPVQPSIKVRDLTPIRDYIAIADVVRAFRLAATKSPVYRVGNVFNIGTGIARSVRDVGEALLTAVGTPKLLLESISKENRRSFLVTNPSRAESYLRWRAECDMQNELKKLFHERCKRDQS